MEAARSPHLCPVPRFLQTCPLTPSRPGRSEGGPRLSSPQTPPRSGLASGATPTRHPRARRGRQLSRQAATFPAATGSALPGPGCPRPRPGAALRWPPRPRGDLPPASAAPGGPEARGGGGAGRPHPPPARPGRRAALTSGGRPLHLRGRAGRVGDRKSLWGRRPSPRGRVRIQAPPLRPGPGPAAGRGCARSGRPAAVLAGPRARRARARRRRGLAGRWRGAGGAGRERMNVLWDHVV